MTVPELPDVGSHSVQSFAKTKLSKSVPDGGSLSAPPEPSLVLLLCLISGAVPQGERASLIEVIFSSRNATDMVRLLQGSAVQAYIDAVDEASEILDLASQVRKKCLRSLYKTCAGHTLLPRSLQIELCDNPTGGPLYGGGFGEVWKREYRGQAVAVKVLKKYENSDLRKITRRFCKEFVTWKALCHPNVLPLLGVIMSGTQFAMVSRWMPNGNINEFVRKHSDSNRFQLLGDVARGLIHLHGRGMVHGDLKGANILIDEAGSACLADFGLVAIISDGTSHTSSSSFTPGGTVRWMSPELFYPEDFGLEDSRRTERSDCYALGMVIYEVLSGQVPFSPHHNYAVVAKVLKGQRPRRPQGAERKWFGNGVWGVLERCWAPKPDDRPRIGDVLQPLEEASRFWTPLSRMVESPPTADLPAQDSSDPYAEGSTEESQTPSPPQSLQTVLQKDPHYEVTNKWHLGTYTDNSSESDPEESLVVMDGAPPARDLSRENTHSYREGSPQPGLSSSTRRSRGRMFVSDAVGVYGEKRADTEVWGPRDLAPEWITKEGCCSERGETL